MQLTYETIAKRIDHSLLNPILTPAEMEEGCRVALRYDVASVCIKPFGVALAAKILAGSTVEVGTTVGFPHGGHATSVKVFETERAIEDGATEIDMVINIGHPSSRSAAGFPVYIRAFARTWWSTTTPSST